MTSEIVDAVVIGAGLAGISAAASLQNKGLNVLLIDRFKAGSGASGAPLALLNPATGRRAKKSWNAEVCLAKTLGELHRLQETSGLPIFSANGVLRPAIDKKLAEQFIESVHKYDWPDDWVEWLDEKEIKKLIPGVVCYSGGLKIKPAATVHLPNYVNAVLAEMREKDISIFENDDYSIEHKRDWILKTKNRTFIADICIHTTGYWVKDFPDWDFLNLHAVKGQALSLYFREQLPFCYSLSALGYIAILPDIPNMLVAGSTYEHSFKSTKPDRAGRDELLKKINRMIPGLAGTATAEKMWSGVRVTSPDKLPVIGEHPEIKGSYILNGFGSKGLIYSRHTADILADYITDQKPIPGQLDVCRFVNQK
ncbi:MAG: NAD(P)/FAD-dependent oxidoreductase [Balneolaceae bacterium]